MQTYFAIGRNLMLSANYLGLALVFIGYATLKNINYLYVLYCIDNFLFVGGIALTTYLNKITTPKDLKPTFAMGVTMNHIAAVTSPLIGGLIWMKFGYQIIFISGGRICLDFPRFHSVAESTTCCFRNETRIC